MRYVCAIFHRVKEWHNPVLKIKESYVPPINSPNIHLISTHAPTHSMYQAYAGYVLQPINSQGSLCLFTFTNAFLRTSLSLFLLLLSHHNVLPLPIWRASRQLSLRRLERATSSSWQLGSRCQIYLLDAQKNEDGSAICVRWRELSLGLQRQQAV